jgi:Domain of unknown function (DUF6089)
MGQSLGAGLVFGGTQYKCDLADDQEGLYDNLRPMKGVTLHYSMSRKFTLTGTFISTYMMAYDNESSDPSRQARNLHFKSNLQELSICFEVYPASFFTKKSLWVKPYLKGGFAFFHFNPKAELNGVWHPLQPLNTEGQGLPLSNKNPYSLYEISHPFGIGMKVDIGQISLRYEIAPRNTETDYLDDVSGEYYNLDELRKYSSDVAAKLSYRIVDWSLENTAPPIDNMIRGNKKNDDWYVIHQVSITYNFGKKNVPIELVPTDAVLPVTSPSN